MKKVVIIGFGRFGQLLAKILEEEFEVAVVEVDAALKKLAAEHKFKVISIGQVAEADIIFLAVPISRTEETIKSIAQFVHPGQLVMDVCSVKVYPSEWMQKYLKGCSLLATHPMFGPDSAKDGLKGLKLVLCPLKIGKEDLDFWKNFWMTRGVEIIVTTPGKHDTESIYSQGFTYTLAKIINLMQIPELKITTKSFEAIKRVADFSANDSDQLFHDMLFYNPYFKTMKKKLEKVIIKSSEILDKIEDEQN